MNIYYKLVFDYFEKIELFDKQIGGVYNDKYKCHILINSHQINESNKFSRALWRDVINQAKELNLDLDELNRMRRNFQ